jgi:Holliday junction DNA helicase RuvA
VITRLKGTLVAVDDESAIVAVDPFEYEVLIPDFTRRQIQMSVGQTICLHTVQYIDGNAQKGGRLTPRLVGFNSTVEREFFEIFCSVDGVGVKKALRAMVRPIPDLARAIEQQDVRSVATLPGIGAATAERIVAKLRRKMPKFALMAARESDSVVADVEHDVVDETFQILVTLGHNESEARRMLEKPLSNKRKFKDVDSLLQAVYEHVHSNNSGSKI